MDKGSVYFLASQMFVIGAIYAPDFRRWAGCIGLAAANMIAMAFFAV